MKDWGTHNRDRLVRSLQLYGFGRWPRIRKEAGASIRSLEVSVAWFGLVWVALVWFTDSGDGYGFKKRLTVLTVFGRLT